MKYIFKLCWIVGLVGIAGKLIKIDFVVEHSLWFTCILIIGLIGEHLFKDKTKLN